jgi:phospholipid/cholesterol/gamma-HCH transport system substrate-binding protein
MRSVLKEHGAEALIGLLVVLVAVWFGYYAWERTGGGRALNAVQVTALFPNANGIAVGTDVRVAGLKVGQVSALKLDPKSYQANVVLALDPAAKLPSDSSAAITSEGILGGNYVSLIPGGDPTPFKDGDTIVDTQGSVDLMGMVGQFINHSGGDTKGAAAGGGQPAANQAAPAPSQP